VTNFVKIRLLLLLFTISCIITAIMIHRTISPQTILVSDATDLERNIHKSERVIEDLFQNEAELKVLKHTEEFPIESAKILDKYKDNHFVYLFVYKYNEPVQWSTNVFVPPTDLMISEKTSFAHDINRSFISKKKVMGSTTVVALIPLRKSFENSNNEYLYNEFYNKIVPFNNLEIAQYTDNSLIKNIYSQEKTYLFSVKLKEGRIESYFNYLEIGFWIAALLSFSILITSLCVAFSKKGYYWTSVGILILYFALLKIGDFQSNWITEHSTFGLFEPKYYALNAFIPNLGILAIYICTIFWMISYLYFTRTRLELPRFFYRKNIAPLTIFILLSSIYLFLQYMYSILGTLVTNSVIPSDLTNIISLNSYSWFCLALSR